MSVGNVEYPMTVEQLREIFARMTPEQRRFMDVMGSPGTRQSIDICGLDVEAQVLDYEAMKGMCIALGIPRRKWWDRWRMKLLDV